MRLDPKFKPERCASEDDERWNLSAPYLDKERGKVVATDGHMLVVLPCVVEEGDTAQHLPKQDLDLARGETPIEDPIRERGPFPRWAEAVPPIKPFDPGTTTFGVSATYLDRIAQALGADEGQIVLTVSPDVNAGVPILVTLPKGGEEFGCLMAVRIAVPGPKQIPDGTMPSGVAAVRAAAGPEAEAPREALYRAVRYLLNRIQADADLGYVAGFGTETHHLLCMAEAAHLGKPHAEVEAERRKTSWCREPRVLELQKELEALRG